ncbi:MAG: adenylate/guanylate cyclase domain-containing protein [Pseudomonadota bacterium]
MPDVFDKIADWLTDQSLDGADLQDTVAHLVDRLIKLGMPLSRFVIGRTMLHPAIGAYDLTWSAATNRVDVSTIPREQTTLSIKGATTPFGTLATRRVDHIRANLTDAGERNQYPVFATLAADGITDYAAWPHMLTVDGTNPFEAHALCSAVSICTKRLTGFTDAEISGFERILKPLFIHARLSTEAYLARVLLETYLGPGTGQKVLSGQSARGMGETIDCVLFYSDMRGSTALSQELDQDAYFAAINQYFDCVAGAVQDHGGEVLKFVGDGVLAIFPIDADMRPVDAMCNAALSSARDAIARAERCETCPTFGVALHVGQVVYGNVGTRERLDYTATGLAVAVVCRCEALTRALDSTVIATGDFAETCAADATPLGAHSLRGLDESMKLFGYAAT